MSRTKLLAACAAASFFTSAANADDTGFYAGASIGKGTQSSDGFDGSDVLFRALGGYSINEYFAVEGGYVDAGEQKDTRGDVRLAVESDGFFAAVLARWPIGDGFSPYLKAGLAAYESTSTASNGVLRFTETESDEDLLFGGGFEFEFGDHVRLRTDYEKVDVPDSAFDIYSVVFTYTF